MTSRIDSIFFFDYTKDIGHYDSIRDFSSEKMAYVGMALSTPKVHVDATPYSFVISCDGSSRVREYTVSQLANLREVEKALAVNSPKYILISYFDGTKRYFAHNEEFCALLKIAFEYQPNEKPESSNSNHYTIQYDGSTLVKPTQNPARSQTTAEQTVSAQKVNTHQSATSQKKRTFPWGLLIIGIAIFILWIALMISGISDNADSELTPAVEPRSGAILSGSAVYNASEITVTASSYESCVVKLKCKSGVDRLSFYVRAGDTVTIGVPEEYLYVYFASGDTWYGLPYLFGDKTSYSMDDDLRDFSEYTWEYTLYPVTNGNFSQTPIDADEF